MHKFFVLAFSLLPPLSISFASEEQLAPIVAQGSDLGKSQRPLVEAPGSFVERDGDSIRKKIPRSLRQALSDEANVNFTGAPRGNTELPQIRGLDSRRILVLDEGVRQNFQAEHGGRVFGSYSLIERAEVIKGPWSSLYGSGAMGGVINIRRSTASDLARRFGKDKGGELALEGGSNGSEFGQRATVYSSNSAGSPLLSIERKVGKDIQLGDGKKLPFSGTETRDVYNAWQIKLGESRKLELKLNWWERKAREPLNPSGFETGSSQVGDVRSRKQDVVVHFEQSRGNTVFHGKPYFRETEARKSRLSDGRADRQRVRTMGMDSWLNWTKPVSDDLALITTAGGEVYFDKNIGRRGAAALGNFPDGKSEAQGVYLQPQLEWQNRWKLTPGFRYDRFVSRADGRSTNRGDSISGKAYLSYQFNRNSQVFAGWGQAFNAPRLQDLYVTGLHFPGTPPSVPNNFFQSNPNLKPERADTFELGYKGNHLIVEDMLIAPGLTIFLTDANDFIARDVNISGGTTRFANLDRVRLWGYEASLRWQGDQSSVGVQYGQVRSKNRVSGATLSDTPADRWSAQGDHRIGAFSLGTEVSFTEAQTRVPSGTDRSGSYWLQDLYLEWNQNPWRASLRVNNIYDRAYRPHASFNLDSGRDVRATVAWSF
jgi:hemoglobin/transferrin/lactoferrin receptor protein